MPAPKSLLSEVVSTIDKASERIDAEIAVLKSYQATQALEPPSTAALLESTIAEFRTELVEVSKNIDQVKAEFFDAFAAAGSDVKFETFQTRVAELNDRRTKLEADLIKKEKSFNRLSPQVMTMMVRGVRDASEDSQRREIIPDRIAMLINEQQALNAIRSDLLSLYRHSAHSFELSADSERFLKRLLAVARGDHFNTAAGEVNLYPFQIKAPENNLVELAASASLLLAEAAIQLGGHSTTPDYPSMAKACLDITARSVAVAEPTGHLAKDWGARDQVLLETRNFKRAAVHSAYWSAFAASQSLVVSPLQNGISENALTTTMLLELREQLEHRGRGDLKKLGYINPVFEMQMFDMGSRGPETPTGGDFALIVTTDFGDGPCCRYIVVQMKPADDRYATIYRDDNARQFRNLGRHGPASFYGFFQQQDPMQGYIARPSVTFRPYSSISKEIEAHLLEMPEVRDLGALASSSWNVDTFEDALDLPSLFAFGLIAGESSFGGAAESELHALEAIAGGLATARAMVDLVAVCSIGRRLNPGLMKAATHLNLRHRAVADDPSVIGRRKKRGPDANVDLAGRGLK